MGQPELPEQYAYMRSYSPYDNVERKAYPAILVTAGLNDPQVSYWEPAKWVAKLRAMKTDSNPAAPQDQHGRGARRDVWPLRSAAEEAFRYAFMLDMIGTPDPRTAVHQP